MMKILGSLIFSTAVSLIVVFWYRSNVTYLPREQINDAVECLRVMWKAGDSKLIFDFTGITGERFGWLEGNPRYLGIIGKDESFGDSTLAVICKIRDDLIEVTDPSGRMVKVFR
jgi:hypothetical protein